MWLRWSCLAHILDIYSAVSTTLPHKVITIIFVIIIWSVVVVLYCRELCWVYSLIVLLLTSVIGVSTMLIGFKSKPLSDAGYFVFFLISLIFIIIGVTFYLFYQLFGPPFHILYGVFIAIGIAFGIFCSTVWLKYSGDKSKSSTAFTIYIISLETMGLFLTIFGLFYCQQTLDSKSGGKNILSQFCAKRINLS
uniref:Uncharacterized protein n=1 Tax=Trichobilharzia regenti TaxID=157069 RepID=A0AA85K8Y4_TRIRE|nr:unnamed protein product [Trichobilharzia regenti]